MITNTHNSDWINEPCWYRWINAPWRLWLLDRRTRVRICYNAIIVHNAQYGITTRLAVDNILAAEVVTSKGQIVWASKEENEDLFWCIRGAGNKFGVVTKVRNHGCWGG